MADTPTWKTGDTYPPFTLANEDGSPIDTTGAESVTVVMKGRQTSTIITGPCDMTTPSQGEGVYEWESDDLSGRRRL